MKNLKTQKDSKAKVKRIKELVQFRKALSDELSGINNYQKKIEKIKKYYDDGKT